MMSCVALLAASSAAAARAERPSPTICGATRCVSAIASQGQLLKQIEELTAGATQPVNVPRPDNFYVLLLANGARAYWVVSQGAVWSAASGWVAPVTPLPKKLPPGFRSLPTYPPPKVLSAAVPGVGLLSPKDVNELFETLQPVLAKVHSRGVRVKVEADKPNPWFGKDAPITFYPKDDIIKFGAGAAFAATKALPDFWKRLEVLQLQPSRPAASRRGSTQTTSTTAKGSSTRTKEKDRVTGAAFLTLGVAFGLSALLSIKRGFGQFQSIRAKTRELRKKSQPYAD